MVSVRGRAVVEARDTDGRHFNGIREGRGKADARLQVDRNPRGQIVGLRPLHWVKYMRVNL